MGSTMELECSWNCVWRMIVCYVRSHRPDEAQLGAFTHLIHVYYPGWSTSSVDDRQLRETKQNHSVW
eukprot:2398696-Amphidinium_carterae.2